MNQRQEHKLDKLFRKKLEDLDLGRQDHLWKGIEDQLKKNKRSGRLIGFAWFTGVLLTFAVVGFGIAMLFKHNSNSLMEKNQNTALASQRNTVAESSTIIDSGLNNASSISKEQEGRNEFTNGNISKDALVSNINTEGLINKINSKNADNQKIINKVGIFSNTRKNIKNRSSEKLNSSNSIHNEDIANFPQSNFKEYESNNVESKLTQNAIIAPQANNLPLTSVTDKNTLSDSKFNNQEKIEEFSMLNSSREKAGIQKMSKSKIRLNTEINDFCFARNLTPLQHFDIDIYYAPEISNRTITAKSESATSYAQKRAGAESFAGASSFGLRLSYVTKNGLALRTGINYGSISERFEYFAGSRIETIINKDRLGNPIDTVYKSVDIINERKNTYKFLDIPIMVGYELDISDFVFSFNTGIGVNLMTKYYGQVYSDDLMKLIDLNQKVNESDNSFLFRRDIGLSLLASFGLNYKLNGKFLLIAEPNLRYYLSPITSSVNPIDQRYLQLGISIGLRYRFY
ncbi:MAG: hypothetical protein HOP11_04735 [Saprospiraceae bacterium]|nr:hypothetical protein [Saprospiraceae bacterium]